MAKLFKAIRYNEKKKKKSLVNTKTSKRVLREIKQTEKHMLDVFQIRICK